MLFPCLPGKGRSAFRQYLGRMTDTEQWAFFTTSVATDPANSCRNPIRPCAPTTMQSMSLLWAYLTTSSEIFPHEERTVVDAFREVCVQEVFHLFQQGLGGRDSVGLALAGEVVGFIDRFRKGARTRSKRKRPSGTPPSSRVR